MHLKGGGRRSGKKQLGRMDGEEMDVREMDGDKRWWIRDEVRDGIRERVIRDGG
jgi:hypothetical protein